MLSWSPAPPGQSLNPTLLCELAVLHGRLPGGRFSSFLLTAQLLACASILNLKRVVGVLFCLKKRSQAWCRKKSLLQGPRVFRTARVRQGVSQSRSPITCHSRKHRLKDWGSGDLLLLSGLCPKGPCHRLSQGSLMDEELEMLVSQWLHKGTSIEQ